MGASKHGKHNFKNHRGNNLKTLFSSFLFHETRLLDIRKKPLTPQLKDIQDIGFDYAEVGLAELESLTPEYKDLPNYIPIEAAHLPEIDFSRKDVQKIKTFIQEFDAEIFIIHAYSPDISTEKHFEKKVDVLGELAMMAVEQDKKLVIENTIEKPDTMKELLDEIPETGYCLDIGHANLSPHPIKEYIEGLGERLIHIHASDNLGGSGEEKDLHLPVASGSINFRKIVQKLKDVNFDGRVTHEIRTFDKDYRKLSMEKWLELY